MMLQFVFPVLTDDADQSANSLSALYSKWKNPVFVRPPTVSKA